jgi:Frigida-like protein
MASPVTSSMVQASFEALEKQRELINTCTLLWKELSDHFTSLEKGLDQKSESLKSKRRVLEVRTKRALDTLRRREISIDSSVDLAISTVEKRRRSSIELVESDQGSEVAELAEKLKYLCAKMDSSGFLDLVLSKRKEADLLRTEVPLALEKCVDPARFVVDAMCVIFPADKREVIWKMSILFYLL